LGNKRIIDFSDKSRKKYDELKDYKDSKYAYVEGLSNIN